ncbi:ester cyclase [Nocardia vinacea]|uniref:ester cyclase n=1 Tax=Nocardia vinacea TaxID=96468 RepID=UPI002E2EEDAA|nr:ester cyclase [Nocardia vinacea]
MRTNSPRWFRVRSAGSRPEPTRSDYRGLPPTGRSVTYNEIFIVRFVDGRIAEIWGVVDVFAQMQQLGAIPT